MSAPSFIQNITQDQGVATIVLREHDPDGVPESFSLYEGGNGRCEFFHDQDTLGTCSDDGLLWHVDDDNAPFFCTNHYFPQEQLGYEFIAA